MDKTKKIIDKDSIRDIRLLAKILNESQLSAVEISEGDCKIRLEKSAPVYAAAPAFAPMQSSLQPESAPRTVAPLHEPMPPDGALDFNNLIEVKSPMIGIFYAAPSPDSPPFVKVGQKVEKGDTLCIIEAMKMLNEITAEAAGEIVDICVQNGQLVEFSQVLFKIF